MGFVSRCFLSLSSAFLSFFSSFEVNEFIKFLAAVNSDICLFSYNLHEYSESNHDFLYKVKYAQTTSGYLVNEKYYDTLINNGTQKILKHTPEIVANQYFQLFKQIKQII